MRYKVSVEYGVIYYDVLTYVCFSIPDELHVSTVIGLEIYVKWYEV